MKNNLVFKLKEHLYPMTIQHKLAIEEDILDFEKNKEVAMPNDIKEYFKTVNGSAEYDEFFFKFQSIYNFKSIAEELQYHDGVPDYSNIASKLPGYDKCFVLCDFEFHLMTYAIRLFEIKSDSNPVYVICGDEYRLIANTFSDFLCLYFNQSEKLFI